MITMSDSEYDKKCSKVADACACIAEAHEQFVNFLTACFDIDLDDPELGPLALKIGDLMKKSQKSLETF